MYVLLIEDDHLQSEWLAGNLELAFGKVRFERIPTEQEFYSRIPELISDPPDIIIIDVMLRWADPSRNMSPPPQKVKNGGYYRAGLRCQEELARLEETRNIPVVLYTVLERIDLEPQIDALEEKVTYLRKDSDSNALIDRIRAVTFLN
jgi:DNA-binding response OmpR family regulator